MEGGIRVRPFRIFIFVISHDFCMISLHFAQDLFSPSHYVASVFSFHFPTTPFCTRVEMNAFPDFRENKYLTKLFFRMQKFEQKQPNFRFKNFRKTSARLIFPKISKVFLAKFS